MSADRLGPRLLSAWRGRALWRRLSVRLGIDPNTYVLLMIEDDADLNRLALQRIDDLVEDRAARGVVVVTDRPEVASAARLRQGRVLQVVDVSARQADDLVSLLELHPFTPRLLVVSWTRPYGSDLRAAVGLHGITVEDVLCLCMLVIRSWSPERASRG